MEAFEAETYLRLLGERLLQDRDPQHHHRSPLDLPATALVVAGVIDKACAERVIQDHTTALTIRAGERGFPHFGPPRARRPRGQLRPRVTMVINHELAVADGLLFFRDLTVTTAGATLRYRWRGDDARPRSRRRMFGTGGGAFPWGSHLLVIEDDHGNRPTVNSGSGGGSDSQWDGELQLRGTLSPTTQWLEIDGTRIELDRRIAPSRTSVEPILEQPALERFLWRRLAVPEMPFGEPVELAPAIDALRAAGLLTGEERLIRELQAVGAQLPGRHGRPRAGGGPKGPIPAPWRSLLARRGPGDGPLWTRVLGAVSPPFDGIQVAFHSIRSDKSGLEADFEVSPNVLHSGALDELPVAWWARDDRGNRHLGHADSWSGGHDSASGTMQFWPSLDRRATELELVVSAEQHQAVVTIPLDEAP